MPNGTSPVQLLGLLPADLWKRSWCYAHITLSDEEAKQYRDMPVINNRELGYLFEPDLEFNRLKVRSPLLLM